MKLAVLLEDQELRFAPHLKPLLLGHQVKLLTRCPALFTEITNVYDAAIVVRDDFLKKLTFGARGSSLENYAGSLLHRGDKEFLVLDPIEHLATTRTGKFLFERYISKLTKPDKWFKQSTFSWEILNDHIATSLYNRFATADIIAVDIETTTNAPHTITCVGYCGIWFTNDGFTTHSIVIPFTSGNFLQWIRKFNLLPAPKIFQNGLFDNQYFLRFGAPIRNWCYDTQSLFHSWYSELPKRLDAISAFLVRDVYYWKQEGKNGNLEDYYRYNAKDTWATANSWLSCINECPDWALRNYREKFPLVFPCLACNFEGFHVNTEARTSMEAVQRPKLEDSLSTLRRRIGRPHFNPGSWQQVLSLIHAIGYKEIKSTDKKTLEKVAKKHPLARILIDDIRRYKDAAKLLNTYIEAQLWNNRLLYSLNPDGTDTGRLACSKSSFFGYGAQIQNIPPYVKEMLEADNGFHLFEIDNKNSEGYCVGYLSGDENLIRILNSGLDFHCANAQEFFGIPYGELFDDATQKVLNILIRTLAKRVNHGANYNMGAAVLIETMGAENVLKARELLELPPEWSLMQIAEFLLEKYSNAYPGVKGAWYDFVKSCIRLTHTLVSAIGWTRYCFGEPWKNKPDLNAYVAHAPQNLSVGIINRGLRKIFHEVQMGNWADFRLKAQIHDSVVGQYRIGRLDLVRTANQLMQQEVPVTDALGHKRIMRIPTDVKAEARIWADLTRIAA